MDVDDIDNSVRRFAAPAENAGAGHKLLQGIGDSE
jgi:hypothetical protein